MKVDQCDLFSASEHVRGVKVAKNKTRNCLFCNQVSAVLNLEKKGQLYLGWYLLPIRYMVTDLSSKVQHR